MKTPQFFERSELGRAIWGFRREFIWVGIFSMFANLLLIAPTLYMLQVFDRVMISRSEITLLVLTLVVLLFFCMMAFAEWVRSRLLVRSGVKFDERLNSLVFKASFDSRLQTGRADSLEAFANLTHMRQFATGMGIFAFFDAPFTPLYLGVLFMMHPVLGYTSVFFIVVLLSIAALGSRWTDSHLEKSMTANQESSSFLGMKLRNSELVESLGMLQNLRRMWMQRHENYLELHEISQQRMHQVQAVTKMVRYGQQSIVLAVGAWLVIHDDLSPASMVAANMLMANALRPIDTMVSAWRGFVMAKKAYLDLEQLLQRYPPRPIHLVAPSFAGKLTLQDLTATAPSREKPILLGISSEFHPGEVVAITGPSGAGKSTLMRCMLGIWPNYTGEILLDGQTIRTRDRVELGSYIGYLPQNIELFEGTIAENISRFTKVNSEWVISAAKQVGIHEMILRFPKGYDTPMGEAGGLLSGGQRQRIALARAIYGTPKLVFLDEPNSNLDDVGETALTLAIQHLKSSGATVFMVIHQKNIMKVATRQLVLKDGQLLQDIQIQSGAVAQPVLK